MARRGDSPEDIKTRVYADLGSRHFHIVSPCLTTSGANDGADGTPGTKLAKHRNNALSINGLAVLAIYDASSPGLTPCCESGFVDLKMNVRYTVLRQRR